MKIEMNKKYRGLSDGMVTAHFNDKMAAYVNAGIASFSRSVFAEQPTGSPRCAPRPCLDADAQRAPLQGIIRGLVAQTNAERTRSANEIAVGPHGFNFSDRVTDFDRADLRAGERNHFPKLARGDQFHRRRAKH